MSLGSTSNGAVPIDSTSTTQLPEIIVRPALGHAVISANDQSNSSPQTSHNWSPNTPLPQGQITINKFQNAFGLKETEMKKVMEFCRLTCQSCGTFDPRHLGYNKLSIRRLEKTKPEVIQDTFAEVS